MTRAVIDTNVPITANGRHDLAGPDCVLACIDVLGEARNGLVLIDEGDEILAEYRRYLSPKGQPGPGDAFYKWLYQNQANPDRCRTVRIRREGDTADELIGFPEHPALESFDAADRKFIAVARESQLDPDVMQATDSKWWRYRDLLQECGVHVRFLCPELMEDPQPRSTSNVPSVPPRRPHSDPFER